MNGDDQQSKAGRAMTARAGTNRPVRVNVSDTTWRLRSLCRNDFRYEDGPFSVPGDRTLIARQLAHRCRAHCPVIEQCAAELMAQAPLRPRKAVRAGVYFPVGGQPVVLDDARCGSHCEGLPDVHRKAVGR